MRIKHVCPEASEPVGGKIIGNGTIIKKDWIAKDGLSGLEISKWKSIKVECDFCGKVHEYALVTK